MKIAKSLKHSGKRRRKMKETNQMIREKLFIVRKLVASRHFAMSVVLFVTALILLVMVQKTNMVSVMENGETRYFMTTAQTPEEILENQGISYREEDLIQFTGFEGKYGEILLERSYPVTIVADGIKNEVYVLNDTVAETLAEQDIQLNEPDMVNLDDNYVLNEGDEIVVQRVNYETRVESEVIPNDQIIKPSSLVLVGTTKVTQPGKEGTKEKVLTDTYIDGKLVETNIVEENVIVEPVDEIVMTGVQESTSPIEPFETLEFDETGRPTNYVDVLTSQTATAYSARDGAKTASGRYAAVGHVAVDPSVIPYGTKLYIETVDGSYVYGYAIAADTGTALLDGRVDVDLFFSSYEESCWFGKRQVNIYILP